MDTWENDGLAGSVAKIMIRRISPILDPAVDRRRTAG